MFIWSYVARSPGAFHFKTFATSTTSPSGLTRPIGVCRNAICIAWRSSEKAFPVSVWFHVYHVHSFDRSQTDPFQAHIDWDAGLVLLSVRRKCPALNVTLPGWYFTRLTPIMSEFMFIWSYVQVRFRPERFLFLFLFFASVTNRSNFRRLIGVCGNPIRDIQPFLWESISVALLVYVLQYEIVSIFAYPWKSLFSPHPTSEAMIKNEKKTKKERKKKEEYARSPQSRRLA